MSDSRRKRGALLRRCVAPQVEAVIAEDYESADYDYDATDGSLSAGSSGNRTRNEIKAPNVSLRSFFPETWLFTLDHVGMSRLGNTDLSR